MIPTMDKERSFKAPAAWLFALALMVITCFVLLFRQAGFLSVAEAFNRGGGSVALTLAGSIGQLIGAAVIPAVVLFVIWWKEIRHGRFRAYFSWVVVAAAFIGIPFAIFGAV